MHSFGVRGRTCGKDEKRQHILPSGEMQQTSCYSREEVDGQNQSKEIIFPTKFIVQFGARNLFYGIGLFLQITL